MFPVVGGSGTGASGGASKDPGSLARTTHSTPNAHKDPFSSTNDCKYHNTDTHQQQNFGSTKETCCFGPIPAPTSSPSTLTSNSSQSTLTHKTTANSSSSFSSSSRPACSRPGTNTAAFYPCVSVSVNDSTFGLDNPPPDKANTASTFAAGNVTLAAPSCIADAPSVFALASVSAPTTIAPSASASASSVARLVPGVVAAAHSVEFSAAESMLEHSYADDDGVHHNDYSGPNNNVYNYYSHEVTIASHNADENGHQLNANVKSSITPVYRAPNASSSSSSNIATAAPAAGKVSLTCYTPCASVSTPVAIQAAPAANSSSQLPLATAESVARAQAGLSALALDAQAQAPGHAAGHMPLAHAQLSPQSLLSSRSLSRVAHALSGSGNGSGNGNGNGNGNESARRNESARPLAVATVPSSVNQGINNGSAGVAAASSGRTGAGVSACASAAASDTAAAAVDRLVKDTTNALLDELATTLALPNYSYSNSTTSSSSISSNGKSDGKNEVDVKAEAKAAAEKAAVAAFATLTNIVRHGLHGQPSADGCGGASCGGPLVSLSHPLVGGPSALAPGTVITLCLLGPRPGDRPVPQTAAETAAAAETDELASVLRDDLSFVLINSLRDASPRRRAAAAQAVAAVAAASPACLLWAARLGLVEPLVLMATDAAAADAQQRAWWRHQRAAARGEVYDKPERSARADPAAHADAVANCEPQIQSDSKGDGKSGGRASIRAATVDALARSRALLGRERALTVLAAAETAAAALPLYAAAAGAAAVDEAAAAARVHRCDAALDADQADCTRRQEDPFCVLNESLRVLPDSAAPVRAVTSTAGAADARVSLLYATPEEAVAELWRGCQRLVTELDNFALATLKTAKNNSGSSSSSSNSNNDNDKSMNSSISMQSGAVVGPDFDSGASVLALDDSDEDLSRYSAAALDRKHDVLTAMRRTHAMSAYTTARVNEIWAGVAAFTAADKSARAMEDDCELSDSASDDDDDDDDDDSDEGDLDDDDDHDDDDNVEPAAKTETASHVGSSSRFKKAVSLSQSQMPSESLTQIVS